MPALFVLDVETGADARRARLHLRDEAGATIAGHALHLQDAPPARWAMALEPAKHVRRGASWIGELGAFVGEAVLGADIVRALAEGEAPRVLVVRLPDPERDPVAAALVRVPWEMARPPGEERSLLDRRVSVRLAPAGARPEQVVVAGEGGEPIRVLIVIADAARPLGARLERERLLDLFFREILPQRNVEVDVLCHGATRARIWEQVRRRGGYHVVHWSGRAEGDAIEVGVDEGEDDEPRISGAEIADLFTGAGAGEAVPRLFFLSTCAPSPLERARGWRGVEAALREPEAGGAEPGALGAALSLIGAGVPQVVAMRFEVGSAYARRLARRFYRGLLAGAPAQAADAALAAARAELAADPRPHGAAEHLAPVVLGAAAVTIAPEARRSAQAERRAPRPQPLLPSGSTDLDPPRDFVGRGAELARLCRRWLPRGEAPAEGGDVEATLAVLEGPAGAGKTSLAAEAVHLWHGAFDGVIALQAFGGGAPAGSALAEEIAAEALHRAVDVRLARESAAYRASCARDAAERAYLPPGGQLAGAARAERQRRNLVEALRREKLLVVLDGFDACLAAADPLEGGAPRPAVARDPAWDELLEALGEGLAGSGSRLLVTSRRPLAALAARPWALAIGLGPLQPGEAALLAGACPGLRELVPNVGRDAAFAGPFDVGRDAAFAGPFAPLGEGRDAVGALPLLRRVLALSRGHPLLLQRLGDLGRAPGAGRAGLAHALGRLEPLGEAGLPEPGEGAEDPRERRHVEEVAAGAIDLLLERVGAPARRLLWGITLAGEPVQAWMIEDLAARLLSPDDRPRRLLDDLIAAGLVARHEDEARGTAYGSHELVAERVAAWARRSPDERGAAAPEDVWRLLGERCSAAFRNALPILQQGLLVSSRPREIAAGLGRRSVRYLVRARAFPALAALAGAAVSGIDDEALLAEMIGELLAAADHAPSGDARWRVRTSLADALRDAGRIGEALPLYAQSAEEAEAAAQWADVGVIQHRWATALDAADRLPESRSAYVRSADAKRRAGKPPVTVIASELEALRIDVVRGDAARTLPALDARLDELRRWWARWQRGEEVPEAPDAGILLATLASGVEIARAACLALERWHACLDLVEEADRLNRAAAAGELPSSRRRAPRGVAPQRVARLVEEREVLEACVEGLRRGGDVRSEARALGVLAAVRAELGDPHRAATLEREALAAWERAGDAAERAASHGILAIYLQRSGQPPEAICHALAALAYEAAGSDGAAGGGGRALRAELRDVIARAGLGVRPPLPRLEALLRRPDFAALRVALEAGGAGVEEIQARIDARVERIRGEPVAG